MVGTPSLKRCDINRTLSLFLPFSCFEVPGTGKVMEGAYIDHQRRAYYRKKNDGQRPGVYTGFGSRSRAPMYGGKRTASYRKPAARSRKSYASKGKRRAVRSKGASSRGASASKIIPSTHDYLLAYGNPFADQSSFKVAAPRVPDDAFTGSSSAIMYTLQEEVQIDANQNNFVAIRGSRAYSLAGMDMAGGMSMQLSLPQGQYAGTLETFMTSVYPFVLRAQRNKYAYSKFHQVRGQSTRGRYVGSGMKMHYLGPVQTQSGQVVATHCGPDFVTSVYNSVWQGGDPVLINALNMYGIGIFPNFGRNAPGGGPALPVAAGFVAQDPNVIAGIFRQAAEDTQVPLGDAFQEFVTSDGVSLRTYTSGTDRPFTTMSPPAIWHGDGADTIYSATLINKALTSEGWLSNSFYDDNIQPIIDECIVINTPQPLVKNGSTYPWIVAADPGVKVGWGVNTQYTDFHFTYMQVGCEFQCPDYPPPDPGPNPGDPITFSIWLLCDERGIPLTCFRNCTLMGLEDQGDAPFMFIQGISQAASSPYKLYSQTYEEVVPMNGSILTATPSPVDYSWREVVHISAGFPSITKGFTFFSKLWDGIKSAAKWVGKNVGSVVKVAKVLF